MVRQFRPNVNILQSPARGRGLNGGTGRASWWVFWAASMRRMRSVQILQYQEPFRWEFGLSLSSIGKRQLIVSLEFLM